MLSLIILLHNIREGFAVYSQNHAHSIRKIHQHIVLYLDGASSLKISIQNYSIVSTVFTAFANNVSCLVILHNQIIRIAGSWHNTHFSGLQPPQPHSHYTWFNFLHCLNKLMRLIMFSYLLITGCFGRETFRLYCSTYIREYQ